MSVFSLTQRAHAKTDESLVELNTETLQVIATMSSDSRATLHFEHVETLHNLMMTEFAELRAIGNNVFSWLTKSANNFIVIFVL